MPARPSPSRAGGPPRHVQVQLQNACAVEVIARAWAIDATTPLGVELDPFASDVLALLGSDDAWRRVHIGTATANRLKAELRALAQRSSSRTTNPET